MGLSKNITLTIKDYEIKLDKEIKFYENDTIDLCFSILEYGIEVKDGISINKLMPIQALTAYMLIETPQAVDYAESTKIEDNKIVFKLGSKYSQFVGIGHMQIVIKDSDGCRVTLPEFEFEIKKSINSDWEKEIYFLSTEDDSIIIDEFGRKIHMSKISDMPESENLSEESYAMIIDEEGNKRFKVRAIADAVEDSLDTKFNTYADEISGDVERIKGEVNEISESLEDMASDIEELKQGDIEIDLTDYAKKSDLEVKADKSYVDSAIESVDVSSQLTNYATKSELSSKVDKVTGKSLISDSEIKRLATLENYDDSNIKNTLNSKADKSELHSHNNKSVLDGITNAKVTEWNNKSTFSGDYNDLTNKPTIPSLSGYATKQYVNEEIEKIDVTEQLTGYAKKSELHSHTNKTVLDGISSAKVTEWDSKSTFSGNYNNLTNKPTIPTKTSQLTNDSGFITSIPNEYVTETELSSKGYLTSHQDISGKADKSTLTAHTGNTTSHITATERNTWNAKSNLALGTTSSTAYRGDYGNTAYKHSQSAHAPSNAQKNSDITKAEIEAKLTGNISTHTHSQYLTSHQSLANYPMTSELSLGVHTDGLIYLFKGNQPVGVGVAQYTTVLPEGDVVGYVDSNNNIVLNGNLSNGTYVLKYEMEDGTLVDVGQIVKGSSDHTNVIDIVGYTNDVRLSTSSGETKTEGATGYTTTGFIEVKKGDVVRTSGIDMRKSTNQYCSYAIFDSNKTKTGTGYLDVISNTALTTTFDSNGNLTLNCGVGFNAVKSYLRLCGYGDGANLIVTVNQEIKPSGYTNLLYLAQEYASTSVYNGKGWKEDTRHSGSVEEKEKPLANHYLTGYIPCTKKSIVRIKNIDITGNSDGNYYLVIFFKGSDKNELAAANLTSFFTEPADDNGVYTSITPGYFTAVQTSEETNFYFRLCALKIDNTSIITVDEKIEGEALNQPNVPSVTYRNLANPSISDWLTDKRLSSGGTIKDGVGCTVTNYIDCKYGDIVRIKGLSMENALPTETSSQIEEYDTNGTKVFYNFVNTTIANNGGIASIDSNGVVSYNVHNEATVKIRICGTTPSNVDDVIITVNQKIEGVAINYTNQVPLSIDTDGTIFNGVGYKDGYRGNSSGGLTALSGCTVTGLIPFNPETDTVRIKGVNRSSSIPSGDFGCIAIYDKSKNFLAFSNPSGHQNTNFTWVNNNYGYVDEDGSYVIYNPSLTNCYIETYISTLKDSTGYIRLCGQGIGKDMIVTINERIR